MAPAHRREFLLAAGGAVASLSGCVSAGFPGGPRGAADITLYVGSYHWGFLLLDESGSERERITIDRESAIDLVAFNTSAETALEKLPSAIREAIPDHETLEERNEERMPAPRSGDFHEALHEANERFPDHSLAVMPSGGHMRGGMGGMMLHPVPLPADATHPTTARLSASRRGDYTLSCFTDCGYGHPYMELEGALLVQ